MEGDVTSWHADWSRLLPTVIAWALLAAAGTSCVEAADGREVAQQESTQANGHPAAPPRPVGEHWPSDVEWAVVVTMNDAALWKRPGNLRWTAAPIGTSLTPGMLLLTGHDAVLVAFPLRGEARLVEADSLVKLGCPATDFEWVVRDGCALATPVKGDPK